MVNSNNLNTNINHQMQPQLKIENNSNGYQITQQNQNSHNYNLNNIFANQNSTNLTNQTQNSVNVVSNQGTNQSNTNSNLVLEQQKSLFLPKQEDPKKKIDNSQSLTNLVENPNKQQTPQMEIVYQSLKSKPQQQEIQKSNKKFINCLVHKDKILEFVCLSNNCLKQKICCQLCIEQSHKGHESISLDLYMNNIKELEKNIEENNSKENSNWEKIQNIFESNTKYLKELETLNVKLNSNIQKLQNSMKIIQDKQNTDSTHLKQKINTLQNICENPKQNDQLALVNEITQLVHFFQKFQSPSVFDYPQIIETIEFNQQLQAYNEQSVQDFQFYITKALEEQESLEKTFNYQEFKLLNQMKKEKNDVKLTQKLTRVFHLIKGKAKKRDIINFITWNPDHKELKFMKDIKEKEEKSHYQLVFSLFIKNLEILEYEQIDDNLMKWLTQQILNVYPSVKKEKEEQRKFISSKPSNKRRYCKFNPKFDIDIKNYLSSTLIDNSINLKISKSDKNLENSENNFSSDY
ncbi:hypothetical protein PPERSA_00609 [Pseudocohnilembus persalinus]|uniref:B box-type domain-containing protein n=1 Tax=Pseudocohnilembus persalinus TaxID=266149 RepID=A0A0V0QSR8_PSEPJ|nr:hypothetical protein PPERSA_00609 [Pseudocohnilembus persalinus]|eukprot:KRX05308.1 hypothetical protein PPERSA_00609 [Pseudocohnilembus persalinus]